MVAPTSYKGSSDIGKARISKSGQITVPAEIRRELGLEAGDVVIYGRNEDGHITIRKPRTAKQLVGIARRLPDGITVSELIEEMDRTPMVRVRYEEDHVDDDID